MRVSTGSDVSSASSMDQSAMYSGCGRGCGHGRGRDFGGGHGSFGTGHNVPSGRLRAFAKGPRQCTHCG